MEDPILADDDGLHLPEVGEWAEEKHGKFGYYAALFSDSMKKKWDCRVFVELFAGAGKGRIKGKTRIVPGSPLVALSLDAPFDRYIFCELDPKCVEALRSRVAAYFPDRTVDIIEGNCNSRIQDIVQAIPKFDANFKGLTLCFVDPFKASDLRFSTVKALASARYVDFVVLIPSFMDIKRNQHIYTKSNCTILDDFLGTNEWRQKWNAGDSDYQDFGVFIADQFGKQMTVLGYHYEPESLVTVRIGQDRSLYLYHLGFFSRNRLGVKFWKEATTRTDKQRLLF